MLFVLIGLGIGLFLGRKLLVKIGPEPVPWHVPVRVYGILPLFGAFLGLSSALIYGGQMKKVEQVAEEIPLYPLYESKEATGYYEASGNRYWYLDCPLLTSAIKCRPRSFTPGPNDRVEFRLVQAEPHSQRKEAVLKITRRKNTSTPSIWWGFVMEPNQETTYTFIITD